MRKSLKRVKIWRACVLSLLYFFERLTLHLTGSLEDGYV